MALSRLFVCFAVIAVLISVSSSTFAADTQGIETVVVTAEKRVENVQDVPISMDVISGSFIDNYKLEDLRDLSSYAPNFTIQQTPGDYQIYIRGIGSGNQNFAFDQDVSMYVDGIYSGRAHQFKAPFFDIERVEILRGPQGALLGKNTAAGAVSIITAQPTSTFESEVNVSTDFERPGIDVWGYISGPIGDKASARLAIKHLDERGYIDNRTEDRDEPTENDWLMRGTLRFDPTADFSVTGKFEYSHFKVSGTNAVGLVPGVVDTLGDVKYAMDPFGVPPSESSESVNGVITADYNFNGFTLTSISGYSAYGFNNKKGGGVSDPDNYLYLEKEHFSQFSEEVRLLSPTGRPLEYILGAYADTAHLVPSVEFVYNLFGGFFAGDEFQTFTQNSNSQSVFGQATWHIVDALALTGSLRYTHTFKAAQYSEMLFSGLPLTVPIWVPPNYLRGSLSESHVDPSVTLQYYVNPDVMLYATYGRGSKAGGFVSNQLGVAASAFEFRAETSQNYEGGIKSTFMDGQIVLDLTVYDTVFKNLQVSSYLPEIAGFAVSNAGSASSKGVEFVGNWYPGGGFSANASIAYLNAKYDNFPGAPCLYNNPGCDPSTNNIGGTTIPFSSKWSGSVTLNYKTPVSGDLRLTLSEVTSFRSQYTIDSNLDPASIQVGFAKVDARIELAPSDDRWSVALYGKNLNNEHTTNFSYSWPFEPVHRVAFLDETRTIGIVGTVRFD